MMKQLTILAVLLLTALTNCTAQQQHQFDTRTIVGEQETLTHLRMLDGNTGEMRVIPPGPEMTAALDLIASFEVERAQDQSPSAGYLYWIAGYRAGKEAFRLTFGGEVVTVEGVRYQLNQNLTAELEALFESVPYGELLALAMADLAADLGLAEDEIIPISVEAHTFPDASLGLPQKDMQYAQVLTPGYIMTLSVDGQTYTYHGADTTVVRARQ